MSKKPQQMRKAEYNRLTKEELVYKLLDTEEKLAEHIKDFDCHVYFTVTAANDEEAADITKNAFIIVQEYFKDSDNVTFQDWNVEESW